MAKLFILAVSIIGTLVLVRFFIPQAYAAGFTIGQTLIPWAAVIAIGAGLIVHKAVK